MPIYHPTKVDEILDNPNPTIMELQVVLAATDLAVMQARESPEVPPEVFGQLWAYWTAAKRSGASGRPIGLYTALCSFWNTVNSWRTTSCAKTQTPKSPPENKSPRQTSIKRKGK